MSKTLTNEDNTMVFKPKLAKLIGLNEAIILSQMNYWLERSNNIINEKKWVYNSYESWQEQICFLSVSTIRKAIKKLETMKLVISDNFNKCKIDKTKWYTIDYEVLENIYNNQSCDNGINNVTSDKNEQAICLKGAEEVVTLSRTIPETTPEITTREKEEEEDVKALKTFRKVVDFYSGNIRLPGSYDLEKIKFLCDEFKNEEIIILAIKESVESNVRNLRYVEKVLYNWQDKGIKTLEEAKNHIENYKKYKGDKASEGFSRKYEKHKWNNSKDSSTVQGKWTGYKPPKPRTTGEVDNEGLI